MPPKTFSLVLSATRAQWLSMLSAAARVSSPKPIPVYGSVLCDATVPGRVAWAASDMDMWRLGTIDADVQQAGRGIVPVAQALAFVKQCPDGPIVLSFGVSAVDLRAGGFKASIPALLVEDFPLVPEIPAGGVAIPRATLAKALKHVVPTVSQEASQYFLRGALLVVKDNAVACVGTDGHQLARMIIPYAGAPSTAAVSTLVPQQALAPLIGLLDDSDVEFVTYTVDEQRLMFSVGADVLMARQIDGTFPAYERIVPKSWVTRIVCDRSAFERAVSRVSIVAERQSQAVKVDASNGHVVVSWQSAEKGDAVEEIASEREGKELAVALKAVYLQNALGIFESEQIACEAKDELSPVVFRPVGGDLDALYIVMPMRS